jgi:hypothetical protein
VRALVMRADLYEEDDFVTALPNRLVASTLELPMGGGHGPEPGLAGAASSSDASSNGGACSAAAAPAASAAPHASYSSLCHELSVDHMCADLATSIAALAALASTAPTAVAALAASFNGGVENSSTAAASADASTTAAAAAASSSVIVDHAAAAHALLDALALRLRLVQSYLSALAALHPMAAIGTADAPRNSSAEAIGAAWSARDVRDAAQRLRQTVEAIAQAAATLQLRVPTHGRGAPNESGPRSSLSSSASDSSAASNAAASAATAASATTAAAGAGAGKFVEPPSAAAVAAAALASSATVARTVGALRPPGFAADVERAMNASAPPRYVRRYGRR